MFGTKKQLFEASSIGDLGLRSRIAKRIRKSHDILVTIPKSAVIAEKYSQGYLPRQETNRGVYFGRGSTIH